MKETLRKIGLTNIEISIYLSLFDLGPTTASKIAEKNKIHRANVYDYLQRLIGKGLVHSTVKDKISFFNSTDPDNLLAYIERTKEGLENQKQQIRTLVKDLKAKKPQSIQQSRIETFQGKEGIESFYQKLIDIAASNDTISIIGTSERILEIFNYYLLNLTKKIKEVNAKVQMIANKDIMKNKYMGIIVKMIHLKVRYLPIEYLNPAATFIFKDYVGFCNFMENPYVILISDKEITDAYRKHFEALWKVSSS